MHLVQGFGRVAVRVVSGVYHNILDGVLRMRHWISSSFSLFTYIVFQSLDLLCVSLSSTILAGLFLPLPPHHRCACCGFSSACPSIPIPTRIARSASRPGRTRIPTAMCLSMTMSIVLPTFLILTAPDFGTSQTRRRGCGCATRCASLGALRGGMGRRRGGCSRITRRSSRSGARMASGRWGGRGQGGHLALACVLSRAGLLSLLLLLLLSNNALGHYCLVVPRFSLSWREDWVNWAASTRGGRPKQMRPREMMSELKATPKSINSKVRTGRSLLLLISHFYIRFDFGQ